MSKADRLTPIQVASARHRRITAAALQDIEANPLSADQTAMFEMFEREAWSHDRRLSYILSKAVSSAAE